MGTKNLTAALRAPYIRGFNLGGSASDREYAYDNSFTMKWRNAAGTADVSGFYVDTGDCMRLSMTSPAFMRFNGMVKVIHRPTTDVYALEVKSEPTIVTGVHGGIQCTVDAKPSTATSAAGINATMSVGRLAATYTMTGGALCGGYSQGCNLGTFNGAGVCMTGHYALLEDGGVFTQFSHVSVLWIDSHLAQTISGGASSMVNITNNGNGTAVSSFDSVFYIHPQNSITNLFTIRAGFGLGLVGDNNTGGTTLDVSNYRLIKVNLEGETHYLIAAKTVATTGA